MKTQTMTSELTLTNELTLDQLDTVSGGYKPLPNGHGDYRPNLPESFPLPKSDWPIDIINKPDSMPIIW
ncbi:MAG: hypothetical protein AAF572_02595 [Cyanobacteria bacterium P01_B01_bin.77]